MWIKTDKESSAGHQSGAIEQLNEEIERNGTISISFKPPTAYETLNPTQIWPSEENLSSPELMLLPIFSLSPNTDYMDSISTQNGLIHLTLPRIPWFLAISHFHSLWKMIWKSPLASRGLFWPTMQMRARVDVVPSTLIVSVLRVDISPGYELCRTP